MNGGDKNGNETLNIPFNTVWVSELYKYFLYLKNHTKFKGNS